MKDFFGRFKNIEPRDILAIFTFLISLIPALFYKFYLKLIKKNLWVICEYEFEARDNGYVFYKYITENRPDINAYYAINKKCPDYEKVKDLGKTVQYASLKHWILYLCADANISSQKGGKPNAAVCYLLEVYGILHNKRFFLQHGVIMNDTAFLHYGLTKMRMFCCGAYPEYEYIKNTFGYPEGYVKYLGLCRFDNLHGITPDPKKIVLMPTWRNWFKLGSAVDDEVKAENADFTVSQYYKTLQSLITNKRLCEFLEQNGITLYYYPHRETQPFLHHFKTESPAVKLASGTEYDIQALLRECSLMITDYSSVNMDFAYMQKPIIYYQFDKARFRKYQYAEGYFSYENDGFGPVIEDEEAVVDAIIGYCSNNYISEEIYQTRQREFFRLHDNKNCERTVAAIEEILNNRG